MSSLSQVLRLFVNVKFLDHLAKTEDPCNKVALATLENLGLA